MKNKLISYIPTLGPIGYLPAPGTCGTLVALPLVFGAQKYLMPLQYVILMAALFFLGIFIIQATHKLFDFQKDPQSIVIDEVVGCMVTFLCIPMTFNAVVLGFFLFRVLDIFKLSFVKKCENLPGAWGIMADDLAAGICANLILQLLSPFLI